MEAEVINAIANTVTAAFLAYASYQLKAVRDDLNGNERTRKRERTEDRR